MNNREIIKRFEQMWCEGNHAIASEIIDENVTFRSSLGVKNSGLSPFIEYLDGVLKALGDFRCELDDMISEGDKIAAKMLFHGKHRDVFFGVEATNKIIQWDAIAFFEIRDGKIQSLWFLGDVDGIRRQLSPEGGVQASWKG